jgi:hypothetical protein
MELVREDEGVTRMPAKKSPIYAGLILVIVLAVLGGCATRSKISASNEIATARFAIRDAKTSGAETYALGALNEAEALVQEAERVKGEQAERLAEKALVRARLASAVAARESARQRLADAQRMERESEALRKRTTRAVEERLR